MIARGQPVKTVLAQIIGLNLPLGDKDAGSVLVVVGQGLHLNAGNRLEVFIKDSSDDGAALNELEIHAGQRLPRLDGDGNAGAGPTPLAVLLGKKAVAIHANAIGPRVDVGESEGSIIVGGDTACPAASATSILIVLVLGRLAGLAAALRLLSAGLWVGLNGLAGLAAGNPPGLGCPPKVF